MDTRESPSRYIAFSLYKYYINPIAPRKVLEHSLSFGDINHFTTDSVLKIKLRVASVFALLKIKLRYRRQLLNGDDEMRALFTLSAT